MGKNNLFVLSLADDEMHEDDVAVALAAALSGGGIEVQGEPREGKINLIAGRDGLLKVNRAALLSLNMLGDVVCSTLHDNTLAKRGQVVAGLRAIPLVVKREIVETAVGIAKSAGGVIEVKSIRKPLAGIVITGSEVYYGRKKDAFSPVMEGKIEAFGGKVIGKYYAPDDESFIKDRLGELLNAGADLLIVTGGMSVDPDDVTRFALGRLGVTDMVYGSPVIPGSMVLIGYIENEKTIPVIGVPACGMYHKTTVFDLLLPRILAGERIGRKELAEMGHGGLCMGCRECAYPMCPFGK
ncbi:MAG: molybdopterin-binding protein, partial [Nitrospirota bacterium]